MLIDNESICHFSDLQNKLIWIGGNDIASENEWHWVGTNKPFNYTRWLLYHHNEHGPIQMPDDAAENEHCVILFHHLDYGWNDLYCGHKHHFICELRTLPHLLSRV